MMKVLVLLLILGVAWGYPRQLTSRRRGRIIGGYDADIKDYPYQLAVLTNLGKSGFFICGAALIESRWALTAAHCIPQEYDKISIRAGSSDKFRGGQVVEVSNVVIHGLFASRSKLDYDFALLKLARPVNAKFATPIPLPPPNYQVKEGEIGVISGWGRLKYNGTRTNILKGLKVPIVRHEVCHLQYGRKFTDSMLCTGSLKPKQKGSCHGDSGGPLVVDGYLIGIVSWGYKCDAVRYPNVYANVARVVKWIHQQIGKLQRSQVVDELPHNGLQSEADLPGNKVGKIRRMTYNRLQKL